MEVELIGGPYNGETYDVCEDSQYFTIAQANEPWWLLDSNPDMPMTRRRGTYRLEVRDETAPPRMYWQGWDDEPVPVEIVQQPVQEQRQFSWRDFLNMNPQYSQRWTDDYHPVVPDEEPF